jgi:hypothetical protein
MVHTLHRVKGLGSLSLDSLKDLLTEEEHKKCVMSPHIERTWYKMTSDVFVSFLFRVIFLLLRFDPLNHLQIGSYPAFIPCLILICYFQQEIAEASDDAARKYYEETPKDEWNDAAVTLAMRNAAKTKQQSFKGQFFKYLAIANPKFGEKFLQEVCSSSHNPLQCIFIQYWHVINNSCASFRSRGIGATTKGLR